MIPSKQIPPIPIRCRYCRLFLPAACILVMLAVGCGRDDRLPTAQVSGPVTLDGKPLPYGEVLFAPVNGRVAKGTIKDGQFTLETYGAADGAVLGRHRVSVTARKMLEGNRSGAPGIPQYAPSLVPAHYADPNASGLEFEVTSGQNEFEIKLSSHS